MKNQFFLLTFFTIIFIKDSFQSEENSGNALNERSLKIKKKLEKINKEKSAIELVNELIYMNENVTSMEFILESLLEKNLKKPFKLALENLLTDYTNPKIKNITETFIEKTKNDIDYLKTTLSKKKKDIIRFSPIFEWSQDDNEIKMRIKFAKNLETPGEKNVSNFKVNCTRAQLEVQAYKNHEDYVVHYYRRLNLYEFIRPHTCKSYKESDGTYIINFHKNQATMFWNFLNQPSEDHYNTYTWMDVHDKYDGKVQYTDFREHAMENLLLSDIQDYLKENTPAKKRRLKRISKALKYLTTTDYENKNYCLSPTQKKYCIIPSINEWGYWMS